MIMLLLCDFISWCARSPAIDVHIIAISVAVKLGLVGHTPGTRELIHMWLPWEMLEESDADHRIIEEAADTLLETSYVTVDR